MSMTMLTILQFLKAFCAYTFFTVVLPALAIGKRLSGRSITSRFVVYFTIGNFYVMNLVFILELLHISYFITLLLGTFIPAFLFWRRTWNVNIISGYRSLIYDIRKMLIGSLTAKMFVVKYLKMIFGFIKKWLVIFLKKLVRRIPDTLLLLAIIAGLLLVFGRYMITNYGYTASDVPVHLYWINALSDNTLYVDGVYPQGFHVTIYYLHNMINMDSYALLRVFALVQNIYIVLMLLSFIKLCCRSRFVPYIGGFIYVMSNFFTTGSFARYLSSLPQEFGMLFMLPSVYFAYEYLKNYKKKKYNKNVYYLAGFALNFSMTLASHFYDTIMIGLFYVAIGMAFFYIILRPRHLIRIIAAGLVGLLIAILPMGIAFATGTPMQGSLDWALALFSSEEKESEDVDIAEDEKNPDIQEDMSDNEDNEPVKPINEIMSGNNKQTDEGTVARYIRILNRVKDVILQEINVHVLNTQWHFMNIWLFVLIIIGMAVGLLCMILRKLVYGALIASSSIYLAFLLLFLSLVPLGLPEIMQAYRVCIYVGYTIPVVFCFALDGIIFILTPKKSRNWIRDGLSLACAAAVLIIMYIGDAYRDYSAVSDIATLETNEAITCLTNIIDEEEDDHWTIVSANDETQMGIGHGYHYETINFLRRMEDYLEGIWTHIPTPSVYIFIEKIPIDYTIHYEKSGQKISKEGAKRPVPEGGGLGIYEGEDRWIVMSRMYYWAEAFAKRFPNEMSVYMENDNFVCYKVVQNVNRVFNFAIDYGYNSKAEL